MKKAAQIRKVYNAYLDEIIDLVNAYLRALLAQIPEFKAGKRTTFRLNGKSLSVKHGLLAFAYLLENSTPTNLSFWTDFDLENKEYLIKKLEAAEAYLRQLPGSSIPKRPAELVAFFEKKVPKS